VPDAPDDAELLKRLDKAIEDGGRLLAELGRLRDAVAARISYNLAQRPGRQDDFAQLLLWSARSQGDSGLPQAQCGAHCLCAAQELIEQSY
jgi:hypothetical protein